MADVSIDKNKVSNETSVTISDFKAKCLSYIKLIFNSKKSFLITLRGTPVARVVPILNENQIVFGGLKDSIVFNGDPEKILTEDYSSDWEMKFNK